MSKSTMAGMQKHKRCGVALLALSALAACGGGTDYVPPPVVPPVVNLTVTGTAATGAALAGAAIAVTCSTNSGTATSAADGTFNVVIGDGKGPCILTATKGATVLRSVTPGAGVANITPLTDMLTDYLATRAGTTAANLLTNTNGKAILSDSKALTDAQAGLVSLLKTNYNVTLSTTNFLTATITTPTGGTQSAGDKDLDLLKTNGLTTTTGTLTPAVTTTAINLAKTQPFTVTGGT
ncbi:MAG: hypothetical protein V4463_01070 [Pseudomonadota bacterium]